MEEHGRCQELMAPHGVGPYPWQKLSVMLATIEVCQVQSANYNLLLKAGCQGHSKPTPVHSTSSAQDHVGYSTVREAHPVRRVAVKQVLSADRASGQVAALVLLELSQVHAAVALHAVAHVPPQPLAQAAQVTEGAVVDVPPRLVVKELADAAMVACHAGVAGPALSCSSTGTVKKCLADWVKKCLAMQTGRRKQPINNMLNMLNMV